MFKYKLKKEYEGDGERVIIGVGVTEKGLITSPVVLESPILELAEEATQPVQAVPTPAPVAPVAAVAPVPATPQTETKENQ